VSPGAAIAAEFPGLYAGAIDISPPSGWVQIVRELSREIAEKWPDVRVHQVKVKFGGLRCYVSAAPAACHDAIWAAEARCERTCERCGSEPAKLCGGGWARTLCDGCEP
jgi:hypothetical protein